jgi:hypothetical protein
MCQKYNVLIIDLAVFNFNAPRLSNIRYLKGTKEYVLANRVKIAGKLKEGIISCSPYQYLLSYYILYLEGGSYCAFRRKNTKKREVFISQYVSSYSENEITSKAYNPFFSELFRLIPTVTNPDSILMEDEPYGYDLWRKVEEICIERVESNS